MEKDWVEKRLDETRVVGDAEDPLVALVLGLLVVATFIALTQATSLFPHESIKDARVHVLQTAGGLLVVLGTYTAVRTATMTRARTASERLISTLALLQSTDEAARIGAIAHLPRLARQRGARFDQEAIRGVLDHVANDRSKPAAAAAALRAITRLPAPDEVQAD